jgi:hypothetical protein
LIDSELGSAVQGVQKDIEYSILASCLVRETEEELREVIRLRKKQLHGIQQI